MVIVAVSYVVQKFSDNWDQVWVGANIATMSAAGPYGIIHDSALAVKGERIAWLWTAEQRRQPAQARGASAREVHGQRIAPGLIDCHAHLVYCGNRVAR